MATFATPAQKHQTTTAHKSNVTTNAYQQQLDYEVPQIFAGQARTVQESEQASVIKADRRRRLNGSFQQFAAQIQNAPVEQNEQVAAPVSKANKKTLMAQAFQDMSRDIETQPADIKEQRVEATKSEKKKVNRSLNLDQLLEQLNVEAKAKQPTTNFRIPQNRTVRPSQLNIRNNTISPLVSVSETVDRNSTLVENLKRMRDNFARANSTSPTTSLFNNIQIQIADKVLQGLNSVEVQNANATSSIIADIETTRKDMAQVEKDREAADRSANLSRAIIQELTKQGQLVEAETTVLNNNRKTLEESEERLKTLNNRIAELSNRMQSQEAQARSSELANSTNLAERFKSLQEQATREQLESLRIQRENLEKDNLISADGRSELLRLTGVISVLETGTVFQDQASSAAVTALVEQLMGKALEAEQKLQLYTSQVDNVAVQKLALAHQEILSKEASIKQLSDQVADLNRQVSDLKKVDPVQAAKEAQELIRANQEIQQLQTRISALEASAQASVSNVELQNVQKSLEDKSRMVNLLSNSLKTLAGLNSPESLSQGLIDIGEILKNDNEAKDLGEDIIKAASVYQTNYDAALSTAKGALQTSLDTANNEIALLKNAAEQSKLPVQYSGEVKQQIDSLKAMLTQKLNELPGGFVDTLRSLIKDKAELNKLLVEISADARIQILNGNISKAASAYQQALKEKEQEYTQEKNILQQQITKLQSEKQTAESQLITEKNRWINAFQKFDNFSPSSFQNIEQFASALSRDLKNMQEQSNYITDAITEAMGLLDNSTVLPGVSELTDAFRKIGSEQLTPDSLKRLRSELAQGVVALQKGLEALENTNAEEIAKEQKKKQKLQNAKNTATNVQAILLALTKELNVDVDGSNLLSTVRSLVRERDNFKASSDNFSSQLNQLSGQGAELNNIREELKEARELSQLLQSEKAGVIKERDDLLAKVSAATADTAQYENSIKALEAKVSLMEAERAALLKEMETERKAKDLEYRTLKNTFDQKSGELTTAKNQLTKLKKGKGLAVSADQWKVERTKLESDISTLKAEALANKSKYDKDHADAMEKIAKAKSELEPLKQQVENLTLSLQTEKELVKALALEKVTLTKTKKEIEKTLYEQFLGVKTKSTKKGEVNAETSNIFLRKAGEHLNQAAKLLESRGYLGANKKNMDDSAWELLMNSLVSYFDTEDALFFMEKGFALDKGIDNSQLTDPQLKRRTWERIELMKSLYTRYQNNTLAGRLEDLLKVDVDKVKPEDVNKIPVIGGYFEKRDEFFGLDANAKTVDPVTMGRYLTIAQEDADAVFDFQRGKNVIIQLFGRGRATALQAINP